MITQTGITAAAVLVAGQVCCCRTGACRPPRPAFKFSLNTATIRGQKLSLAEEVEIAAKAGYHAVEPWVEEIHRYVVGRREAGRFEEADLRPGPGRAQRDRLCRLDRRRRCPPRRRPGAMEARCRPRGVDRRHSHGRAAQRGLQRRARSCGAWPSATGSCSTLAALWESSRNWKCGAGPRPSRG